MPLLPCGDLDNDLDANGLRLSFSLPLIFGGDADGDRGPNG